MAAIVLKRRPAKPPVNMTLVEHLAELRRRIIISMVAVAVGGALAFTAYDRILDALIQPYCGILPDGRSCNLYVLDPLEGITTRLKVATFGGIVLALPVVLYQLWRFITPGLTQKERRYAVPFVVSSMALFCGGAAVALYTFPRALEFLVGIGGDRLETIFSPGRYLHLVMMMAIGFGLAFLFPVVLVFLELVGIVSSRRLRSWRRYAVVLIVVAAAVITPSQDPYSLLAMAGPMCVFYEIAILIGRALKK